MSTTTTTTARPVRRLPSMGSMASTFHAGKFIAYLIVVIGVAYAAYNGYIALPNITAVGGLLTVIVMIAGIIGLVATAFADRRTVRVAGVIIALIAGAWLAVMSRDGKFDGMLDGFNSSNTLGLVITTAVVLGVGVWLSRKH